MIMLNVGKILRKARKEKRLSLEEASSKIKVQRKYLGALEENNWDFFSSKVYIVGILKNYSRLLDLDEKAVLAYFRRDYEKKETVEFRKKLSPLNMLPESKKLFLAGLGIAIVIFIIYFGFQVRRYITPPEVIITAPTQTVFRNREFLLIEGNTEPEATITIFETEIYTDPEGNFSYKLPLKEGENKVVIEVTGANGKQTVVERNYVLE